MEINKIMKKILLVLLLIVSGIAVFASDMIIESKFSQNYASRFEFRFYTAKYFKYK